MLMCVCSVAQDRRTFGCALWLFGIVCAVRFRVGAEEEAWDASMGTNRHPGKGEPSLILMMLLIHIQFAKGTITF